ncbi:MAG: hypothetical protein M3P91_07590 [Actinomycetota bacterium]|nr:hypothetical protein [Actinomycetota bacterium]
MTVALHGRLAARVLAGVAAAAIALTGCSADDAAGDSRSEREKSEQRADAEPTSGMRRVIVTPEPAPTLGR